MRAWSNLRGQSVTVVAADVTYRGTVVEMGEAALVLKCPGGFQEIAWERITRIEQVGTQERAPARKGPLPQGWG